MGTHRRRLYVAAIALLVPGAACSVGDLGLNPPKCDTRDSIGAVVIEAQSVPTAARVPCVQELPPGVSLTSVRINSGQSEFVLGSDRAGTRALVVRLRQTCDTAGATEIVSDQDGTRRFERIRSVTPGFAATRSYTFKGGCITYEFRLSAAGRPLVNEISLAVGSVSRSQVAAAVKRLFKGHAHL
jgi:hypothetical protein